MRSPGWRFCLLTFGCKVNQYESQALREAWLAQGGQETGDLATADIVCINSCAITARGERDARNAVFRARREAARARIILTGCATRLFAGFVPRRGQEWHLPDLLVPQEDKASLLNGPWPESQAGLTAPAVPEPTSIRRLSAQAFPPFAISDYVRARAILKIQDGCDHYCSFCIVPQTRGKPVSRQPGEILAEARRLIGAGHAELVISGINLAMYGKDWQGREDAGQASARDSSPDSGPACGEPDPQIRDFWGLLAWLDKSLAAEFAGQARLRISSLEPGQLDQRGLEVLASARLVCPQLHISLQHGSDKVLKRMNRGHYSAQMLRDAVTTLARHWPLFGLGADLLVGFPGETEADLEQLLALASDLPFSYAHVFPYSARPGTAAARMPGQLPAREKAARAAAVRQVIEAKKTAFLQRQLELPEVWLALNPVLAQNIGPDSKPAAQPADDGSDGKKQLEAVNEYYSRCLFAPQGLAQIQANAAFRDGKQANDQPEKAFAGLNTSLKIGLIKARPVKMTDSALEVELLFS